MTSRSIDLFLALNLVHAGLKMKLDDDLGTLHGLSMSDFLVLHRLSLASGGRLPLSALVSDLGVPLSGVVRQLMALEKIGLLQRESDPMTDGRRCVAIRPAARRLVKEALASAELVCSAAFSSLAVEHLAGLEASLCALCAQA
jgi:MarR family transcriptional regulator, organic hydroperoxide resistance regulator